MRQFLAKNAVFTVSDLDQYLFTHGANKTNTRKALLTYYWNKGLIVPVRYSLYMSVSAGEDPEKVRSNLYFAGCEPLTRRCFFARPPYVPAAAWMLQEES